MDQCGSYSSLDFSGQIDKDFSPLLPVLTHWSSNQFSVNPYLAVTPLILSSLHVWMNVWPLHVLLKAGSILTNAAISFIPSWQQCARKLWKRHILLVLHFSFHENPTVRLKMEIITLVTLGIFQAWNHLYKHVILWKICTDGVAHKLKQLPISSLFEASRIHILRASLFQDSSCYWNKLWSIYLSLQQQQQWYS